MAEQRKGIIQKLFGKKKQNIQNSYGNSSLPMISFLNGDTLQITDNDSATNLSAVYSAISVISNTMSKMPFYIINRKTKERIEDDNLYNLLNFAPNERMNAVVMNKLLAISQLTNGNAYALPVRAFRSNKVEKIIPLMPEQVTIQKNLIGEIFYDVNLPDREEILRLRYDEIIHFKEKTLDGVIGISPIESGRLTIQTGLNQENFQKDFYENYGRPSDYLKTASDLSGKSNIPIVDSSGNPTGEYKSMKQVMREEWDKAHDGKKRFYTAILDNGIDYATVPQLKQADMEFVSSKQANVEDIARFFDMASCSFKLGIGKQTYSNNEQGQICYITETIAPRLRQWETELTLKLLTEEQRAKGWVIKGNLNEELRGDTTSRANWYDKMRSMGVYNINEIRAYEDLPSIGDDGETRLIGANSVPLQRLLNGDTAGSVTPNAISENDK